MSLIIYIIFIVVITLVIILIRYVLKNNKEKQIIKEKLNEEIKIKANDAIQTIQIDCNNILTYLENVLTHKEHYFTETDKNNFLDKVKTISENFDFLKRNNKIEQLNDDAKRLYEVINSLDIIKVQHNKDFIKRELDKNKEFFDNVLDYPLDKQQRESIVKLEDNCLVISSAGSGKTSTMIGKLLYLVHQRRIQPSRILTITYTHKASDELSQRLLGTGLSCMTFHKLAMTIVAKVEGEMPSIADNSLFAKVFYNQMSNPKFAKSILNYLTDYRSLVMNEHDYVDSVEYYRDRRKYGVIALYTDKDDKLISTKSEEEKKICSYLTELGISFKYEEPYEYETLTEDYRQYKPDFTIYYTDKDGVERKLYLEHYAINALGQVPQWFGKGEPDGWNKANESYLESIEWKKKLHAKNCTKLINTTSADFHDKTIRVRLRTLLIQAGVSIKEPTTDELIEKILVRNKSVENALMQMTQSFINLVKANGKTIEDVRRIALEQKSNRDVYVIENIMKPLWDDYQNELTKRKEMDFTDVIVKATNYCKERKWNQKYEFILVDEFQDISIDRYRFLQALRTDLPKTKLYCVGDDWQSIYRFSGSDLSLFSDFSKYFGHTEECRIETTYRFGNPLIDESARFIQNNPLQKKKQIHPRSVNPPETKISYKGYRDNQELQELIERMVARVPNDKTAYIISRYSYDIRALSSPRFKMEFDANNDNVSLTIGGRKIKFMTIHGSKGLEADYVFILNCNSGLYGFPSLVSDDPVLDYVLSNPEHYEYAEERRVFYVGITRAKVHTVVLYNVENPSPFVTEMNKEIVDNPNPCPWCGVGRKVLKYEGWTKQKTPYRVWGCTNKEANCQYFEREFSNHKYMHLTGRRYNPTRHPKP